MKVGPATIIGPCVAVPSSSSAATETTRDSSLNPLERGKLHEHNDNTA
jgi:hypothetical protein